VIYTIALRDLSIILNTNCSGPIKMEVYAELITEKDRKGVKDLLLGLVCRSVVRSKILFSAVYTYLLTELSPS
jgi:hypothetical protein